MPHNKMKEGERKREKRGGGERGRKGGERRREGERREKKKKERKRRKKEKRTTVRSAYVQTNQQADVHGEIYVAASHRIETTFEWDC
eukprot:15343388-Ditylum_brightwellii.AAC.1